MRTKNLWILLTAAAVVGLVGIGIAVINKPYRPVGSVIEPPAAAPPIELTTTGGSPFSLSDLEGRIVLLFFGYTHCPDVCPTTVADIAFVADQLGEDAEEMAFLFVTVDAPRDTPEILADYLAGFDPDFIGLTGSETALEKVYADYNVGVSQAPAVGVPGYAVEHISRLFVIDRAGRLIETFAYGLDRRLILQEVQYLIRNGGF